MRGIKVNMLNTRRTAALLITAFVLAPATAVATGPSGKTGMTDLQKMMITTLPVLPWLSLAETRQSSVRAPLQEMISNHQGYVMITDGTSVETGGSFINLATSSKAGLMGIPGCRMMNLDFDGEGKAQLVSLSVDRGWRDKNVAPLLSSLTQRYASITSPVTIRDGGSEAADATVLFDIGRFVVELQIPQHGTLLTVTFTSKAILTKLRIADGTFNSLAHHLRQNQVQ